MTPAEPQASDRSPASFTVVIPLFNKGSHIRRALDSVLSQTHEGFEVIVVDDGSTDEGPHEVRSYADPRIRMVQQPNQGVARARNRGVDEARHHQVAFLDADDEWEPGYLQELAHLWTQHPSAGLCATNYQVVENDGTRSVLEYPGTPDTGQQGLIENYFESALRFTPVWTSAASVRRDVFLAMGGFPADSSNGEDLDLWCRIALQHPIAYLNEPLSIYRRDSANMLSRVGAPCWFPFLDNYRHQPSDRVAERYVLTYITTRQLQAASTVLLVNEDRHECRRLLSRVRSPRTHPFKYLGLQVLSRLPATVARSAHRTRLRVRNAIGGP